MNISREEFLEKHEKNLTEYYNRVASEIRGNIPSFYLSANSSESYYNPENRAIHIGFSPLFDGDEKENKICMGVEELIGHEVQHGLSTTEAAWNNVVNNGPGEFVKYIADKKGVSIKLGETAYRDALMESYNISQAKAQKIFNYFQELSRKIVNSVEDGRIERIRSYNYPGFRKKVLFLNFFFWDKASIADYLITNPQYLHTKQGVLKVVMRNLLHLSVVRYYSKHYENLTGDLRKECDKYLLDILPFIRKAVTASSCRQMSFEALNICQKLAPLVMEVVDEIFDNQDELPDFSGQVKSPLTNGDGNEDKDKNEDGSGSGEDKDDKKDGNGQGPTKDDLEQMLEDFDEDDITDQLVINDGQIFASGRDEKTGEDIPEDFDISKDSELLSGLRNNDDDRTKDIKQHIKRETKTRERPKQVKIDVIGNETALPDILPLIDTYGEFEEIKRPYELKNKLPADLLSQGEDLKRRIKEALTIRTNTSRHKKSGKIRSLDIFRLGFNDTDIFNNRETNPADVVCYILADNSGSMGDGDDPSDNRYHELRSLAVIEHAFSDVIPLKISSFNTWSGTIHRKLKDFDEKVFNNSSYNFLVECGCEGANDDAFSIAVATKELLARTEANKLLFVLSDGLPCCNKDKLTDEVVNARNMGVKVVPIYFGPENNIDQYKELYLEDYIISKPEDINIELEKTLLSYCFN